MLFPQPGLCILIICSQLLGRDVYHIALSLKQVSVMTQTDLQCREAYGGCCTWWNKVPVATSWSRAAVQLHLQGTPGPTQTGAFIHPNEHVLFIHPYIHLGRVRDTYDWERMTLICLNSAPSRFSQRNRVFFLIKSSLPAATTVMCLATLCETDEHGGLPITFHIKSGRLSACDWEDVETLGSRTCWAPQGNIHTAISNGEEEDYFEALMGGVPKYFNSKSS